MRLVAMMTALVLLAGPGAAVAAPLEPLVSGWEAYFKLDWQAEHRAGRPVLTGHVLNDWGVPAASLQLLVEGLDGSGAVISQRVEWLGTMLTPGTRAYFELPVSGTAPAWRVSVFAFDWVEADGGELN